MEVHEPSIDVRHLAALIARDHELVSEIKRLDLRQAEVQAELAGVRGKVERIARAARRIGALESRPLVTNEHPGSRRENVDARVLRFILGHPDGTFAVAEIVLAADASEGAVRSALVRLKRDGHIVSAGNGLYKAAPAAPRPRLLDPVLPEKIPDEFRDGLAGGFRGGA